MIITILMLSVVFGTGCSPLFFYPQKVLINNPQLSDVDYRDIFFKSSDGLKLHGWYLKTKEESKGTILFLHGNAENISTHVSNVIWLVRNGYDVFIFDYRGYGKSEGRPAIEGVHVDAEAALELLVRCSLENTILNTETRRHGGFKNNDSFLSASVPQWLIFIPFCEPSVHGSSLENNPIPTLTLPLKGREINKRLIVFGQSLGGAIAVYTVANSLYKDSVDALIIDSAFSGYRLITREKLSDFIVTWPFKYPLSYLVNDYYSPVNWISKVNPIPVLLIHGDKDVIVPVHHSSILYDKALQPKELWILKDSGHIEGVRDKDVRERLLNYLERLQ